MKKNGRLSIRGVFNDARRDIRRERKTKHSKRGNAERYSIQRASNGRQRLEARKAKEKSFNSLSAWPASWPFSSSLYPSFPFIPRHSSRSLFLCPLVPASIPLCLDPHRYLDGRTKAANRKPNNLGHFWQTMPSKCNSDAFTHSLGHPSGLEFQVAGGMPSSRSVTLPRSSYSDFLLVRSFLLLSATLPPNSLHRWDLTSERDRHALLFIPPPWRWW